LTCTKCGELLDASPGKSVNFCPNCGSKVSAAPATAATDSAEAALRHIADNYGADVLLGSKIVTYFADITRNQFATERKLIKMLSDEGALDCLKAAIGKPDTEQALAVKRGVARLPFAKADGESMLCHFAKALGWQIQRPQPDRASPLKNSNGVPPVDRDDGNRSQFGSSLVPIVRSREDFEELKRKASYGDPALQCAVGDICADYNRTEFLNFPEAVYWYKKAAEQGNSRAQWLLGVSYSQGIGVEVDTVKGEQWLLKSAEIGDADGQYALGGFYSLKNDYTKAALWMGKAAKQGHKEASAMLGALEILSKVNMPLNK
jgi:TPR repeat protein